MLDQFAVLVHMRHRYAAFNEHLGKKFRAVALLRSALAAEEGKLMSFSVGGRDALDAHIERGAGATTVVVDVALLVIAGGIVWAAAQRIAEKDVADLVFSERSVQSIARELGPPAGVRDGSHIPDVSDPVASE
jgi:hypothetical protein